MYISFFIAMGGIIFCLSMYVLQDYRSIYLITILFQILVLPYCFWVRETLYFLQDSMDFRETLRNLIYIHDMNGVSNLLEIKKMFLISLEPEILLRKTKTITFRKKTTNMMRGMVSVIDTSFIYYLILVVFLSAHLEGLE